MITEDADAPTGDDGRGERTRGVDDDGFHRRRRRDRRRWTSERVNETTRGREKRRGGGRRRGGAFGGAGVVATLAWSAFGVGNVAEASTTLVKGVARNGFVSNGEYKYYKVNVACVEAAQPLTLELTTSNGNADLYVSRTSQPTTTVYEGSSANTGNALDSVTISSPVNGYYYVSVYGALSSTYKLRATTTMFTGKHPCTGFRITDSDVSSVGSGSGNQFVLQEALTASAGASFTADLSVDGDVILGNAYVDSVTVKGEMELGVTDSTYYSITRQPPSSPSTQAGGALAIIGANATFQGGSVKVLGGAGGTGTGGDVTIEAGSSSSGNGGSLNLRGGTSTSGTGGDVVIDAGDGPTNSTYEGVIHIGPNAASYVRVGEDTNKQVQTDIFGDLTVHGNLLTTNDLVFRTSYTSYVQVSTSQDGMFQQEVRTPKLTGLDAEDIGGTPTSTLTLDAGTGGSEKYVVVGPTEAMAVYIGSSTSKKPVTIRQGSAASDVRLEVDSSGGLSFKSASGQDITLTSGADVSVASAASGTLALKQDSTDILSWDTSGAATLSSASGQALSVTSTTTGSGDGAGGDVTVSGGTTNDAASGGDLSLHSGGAPSGSANGQIIVDSATGAGTAGAITVRQGSASGGDRIVVSTSGALTASSASGQDITLDSGQGMTLKTAASQAFDVQQNSVSRIKVETSGALTASSASGQDITLTSGADVSIKSAASGTLALKQDSTDILSWDANGAATLNSASGKLTLSTGGTAAVTVDSSGQVGIGTASPAFELEVTGDIAQDGKKLHVNRRWEVDLTSQSDTLFYPVELKHSHISGVSTPAGEPITFKMFGASLDGSNSYNEVTLVGECRGGGWSDHHDMCDVYKAQYDTTESRFLGVYASDNDYTSGFVIYTRGGYNYSVITDARDVVAHTSAYAATSSVTFAIKDSSGADSSGTSSHTFQMIDLDGAHNQQRIIYGDLTITGNIAKGGNTFRIDHPLPSMRDTHLLYHSVIEGPRADNMYRGKSRLVNGRAIVNIDVAFNMTPGTFEALNRDIQCFTSNESGWEPVRGSVGGAVLVIESRDPTSVDVVSWMVIGERQDRHMFESTLTDENGRLIPEHRKSNAGS